MFDKTEVKEINRAVLVGLNAPSLNREENATDESLEELAALLDTAGGVCLGTVLQNKPSPDPRTFIGEGKTEEVKEMRDTGYNPYRLYSRDATLHRVLDQISQGFKDGIRYDDLVERLLFGSGSPADEYMLLADFVSYADAMRRMADTYGDRTKWNQMSLHNIARSGIFAADRSIADYADRIWHVPYKK